MARNYLRTRRELGLARQRRSERPAGRAVDLVMSCNLQSRLLLFLPLVWLLSLPRLCSCGAVVLPMLRRTHHDD